MFASSGNEIKLWDLESNELVNEFPVENRSRSFGPIHTFFIRPDNTQIASVIDKDCIKLINLNSDEHFDLSDASEPKCCCYDSTGRHIAVGTLNSFIELYDFKSQTMKKKTWKLQPSSGSVNCISWSKTDRYIATGNSNGSIVLFNTVVNTFSKPLVNHKNNGLQPGVTTLQYSIRNPTQLASGYDDGSVILWDTNKDQPICVVKPHSLPCTSVVLSPINSLLMLSTGLDSTINFHDYISNKSVKTLTCNGGITSFDMYSNGCNFCVGTANGFIYTYDLRFNNDVPLNSFKAHDSVVHCVKYLQNLNPSTNSSIISKSSINMTSTNNSIINGHSNQQTEPTISSNLNQLKKSNSYNFDLQQNSNPALTSTSQQIISTITQPSSLNIYSPENHKNTFKLKPQVSGSNIVNYMDTNESSGLVKTRSTNLSSSSTSNLVLNSNMNNLNYNSAISPIGNGLAKASNFSKISRQRGQGDIYSPFGNMNGSNRMEITNDENISNGTLVFNQASPSNLTMPKMSSTQINPQNITPKQISPNHLKQTTSSNKTPISTNNENNNEIQQQQENTALATLNIKLNTESNLVEQKNTLLPLDMIREIIKDSVDDFRDELMSENFKFKAEILKEFMSLKREIQNAVRACSINDALVDEIQRLREENKRLRKMF